MKIIIPLFLSIALALGIFTIGTQAMEYNQKNAFNFENYQTKEEIEQVLKELHPSGSDSDKLKIFLIGNQAHFIAEKEINKDEEIKKLNVLFNEKGRENNTNYANSLDLIQQKEDGICMYFRYSKTSSFGSISEGWMIKVFLYADRKIKNIKVSKEITGL